jgi:hypothetical protein
MMKKIKQITPVSYCRETWVAVDNKFVFLAGKSYKHANASELAIKGEAGIIMWMSKDRYEQHFTTKTARRDGTA